MEIAKLCQPRLIIGIDTDNTLIESAQKFNKRVIFQHEHGEISSMEAGQLLNNICNKKAGSNMPSSSSSVALALVPRAVTQSCSKRTPTPIALVNQSAYPYNIKFLCKTVFELSSSSLYEVVLCLSVVKWVHLQDGDAGLLQFLRRLHGLLRWDGLLILEFQPWKSYVNNKSTSERTKEVFGTIRIRPENFQDILVHDIGFDLEGNIGADVKTASGFNRPIFLLRKKRQSSSSNAEEIAERISAAKGPPTNEEGEGDKEREEMEVLQVIEDTKATKELEKKDKKRKKKKRAPKSTTVESSVSTLRNGVDDVDDQGHGYDYDDTNNKREEAAVLRHQEEEGLGSGSIRKRKGDGDRSSVGVCTSETLEQEAGTKRKR